MSCNVTRAAMVVMIAPALNNLIPPAPIIFMPIRMISAAVGSTFTPVSPIQTPATMASAFRLFISLTRGSDAR
ncbi:hypothetical protein D3C87_2072910 [compost metagenome]